MIYTYLIKSKKDNKYYTGISANPEKRLDEHNSGKLGITSNRRPFDLVYWKVHNNYQEARRHELWLKKKSRQYKELLSKPL